MVAVVSKRLRDNMQKWVDEHEPLIIEQMVAMYIHAAKRNNSLVNEEEVRRKVIEMYFTE